MKKNITRFFIVLFIVLSVTIVLNNDITENLVYTNADSCDYVYLGGKPLGIELLTDGVLILGTGGVVTDNGIVFPLKNSGIKSGDVLMSIGGIIVKTPNDITSAIEQIDDDMVIITIKRKDTLFDIAVYPKIDKLTNEKRLGLNVSDNITGVGTLTYVKENGCFGALGHNVSNNKNSNYQPLSGNIYNCNILGVNCAKENHAGELIGSFNINSNKIGKISKINDYGVFGKYYLNFKTLKRIVIANRQEIKHGKAFIYTCIDGDTPDYYSIDIIKTYNQSSPETKSMVISVTDKRLIKKSGGIVQGMSGSPIIQNGKLIGAVTHVFVGNATKGYGVYIDWMLHN